MQSSKRGYLGYVDTNAVAQESAVRRATYYGQCLDDGFPAADPVLAAAVIARIGTGHVDRDLTAMVSLVR